MTPADYARPDDDLRARIVRESRGALAEARDSLEDLHARLEIAEATNHVLTELLYRLVGVLTPAQMAILGLPGHLSRPLGRRSA